MKYHICKITDCKKKTSYKTICSKHWYQVNKFGKPVTTKYDSRPAVIEGLIAKLPLGVEAKDGYTLIDKEFAYLDKFNWRLNETGYVVATINRKIVKLHRLILKTPKQVDHINMDRIDNRKSNLRPCTNRQNAANRTEQSNNTSGYKGVYKRGKRWCSKVVKNGKQYHAGTFDDPTDAAKAYDQLAKQLFGEFAYLNIKTEG